jgi:pyruvate/2-oxoglutarate dehydrogenase complex dihydrolipoamide dehydrogenase (E3) component
MRCLQCFSNLMTKHQFVCAINPVIGHEYENKFALPPAKKKKVLVAGGGIGGMQAALTAAERGHEVILCERTGKLGGALLCEDQVLFKKHLAEYIELQARNIGKTAIDIRLNTAVTPELAESLQPDVIIAALGARPVRPNIMGIDGASVFSAEEIYYHPEKAGMKVAILGGGLVGAELGIHLAKMGKDSSNPRAVSIVEMLPVLNDGGNMLQGIAIGIEIRKLGINVMLNTKALEITEKGIAVEGPDGRKLVEADTVIYAVGQKPLREDADALRFCAPEFYQLGDCLAPKNITEATKAAYQIARDIGRI